jgi:hypothetical protein
VRQPSSFRAFIFAAGFALAACTETEPYVRAGDWRPLGANAANLRAMVANPNDLVAGHGELVSDGEAAADPVTRLREGNVHPLPNSALTDVKVNDAGSPAPPVAPPAGAAPPAAGTDASGAGQ